MTPDNIEISTCNYHKEHPSFPQPILYLVSSKTGLGHVSRAVAIGNQFDPNIPIKFGLYPHLEQFLKDNMPPKNPYTTFSCTYYDSPSSWNREGYDERKNNFLDKNPQILSAIQENFMVVTDFLASIVFLRDIINNNNLGTMLIGVYHSFDGYHPLEEGGRLWQSATNEITEALDIIFLVEPKRQHRPPYLTKTGTLVIPTGPVVRKATKTPSQVKEQLGLTPNDKFILVQAGMQRNDYLVTLINYLCQYIPDYKFVLLRWGMDNEPNLIAKENLIQVNNIPDGHNIVAAAEGVIGKPGMQTLSECIAYQTPLIFLQDKHPERELKVLMLREVTDDNNIPTAINPNIELRQQLCSWINSFPKIRNAYSKIKCNGAETIAGILGNIYRKRQQRSGAFEPTIRTSNPPWKGEGSLSLEESSVIINQIRQYILNTILMPLQAKDIHCLLVAFGGVAKGILRPNSDADLLLVLNNQDLQKLFEVYSNIEFNPPLSVERLNNLIQGKFDALRLKTKLPDGRELNISLMSTESYRKIFSPNTKYFKEELGERISGRPYTIADFQGIEHEFPKVYTIEVNGHTEKHRLSPGIITAPNGRKVIGVKERMLLTSEVLHDSLSLGAPDRKLMRGVTRAICYWNNLYEIDNKGNITGIKPEAFHQNYLFRILMDPLYMYAPEKARRMRNLFFNELWRIDIISKKYH